MQDRPRHRRRRLALALGWAGALAVGVIAGGSLALGGGHAAWWLLPFLPLLALHPLMDRPGGVPVLMYHSVSSEPGWLPWADTISLRPEAFERQLRILRSRGHAPISLGHLVESRRTGGALPARPVVVTLDDGYLDNWVAAWPLLRRYRVPATVFVSLDFIEPDERPRPNLDDIDAGRATADDLRWAGYLNRGEIARLVDEGLVDIQAHGTDHGRVEIGPEECDVVGPTNWRRLAWVQWRAMEGAKWGWHRTDEPVAAPYGTAVRRNEPALAARRWTPRGVETAREWEERLRGVLRRCREELATLTGNTVRFFCWPEHGVTRQTHEIAIEEGFEATCGGDLGENRPGDDPTFVGRVHSGERILGFSMDWADDLLFHAKLRTHQGCYYWFVPLLAGHLCARWMRSRRSRP